MKEKFEFFATRRLIECVSGKSVANSISQLFICLQIEPVSTVLPSQCLKFLERYLENSFIKIPQIWHKIFVWPNEYTTGRRPMDPTARRRPIDCTAGRRPMDRMARRRPMDPMARIKGQWILWLVEGTWIIRPVGGPWLQ